MEFSLKRKAKTQEGLLTEEELSKRFLTWPDSFYKERSPKLRWQMLNRADELGLTKEENPVRKKFFLARYPGMEKRGEESEDLYLKAWMEFRFQAQNAGGLFAKKKKAEALKVLKDMGYFDARTEEEKRFLAQELTHLGLLYISLCHEDKGYTSIVFGVGNLSDESIMRKIGSEFRTVAVNAPKMLGIENECQIWTESLMGAYNEIYPGEV